MRTYLIHLIRHGMPEGASEGRYVGHTDVHLSEEGKEDIKKLCEEMNYPYAQAVFTSPLSRCTETAAIIYPNTTPLAIDGLIECNFGEFENQTAEELANNEDFSSWLAGKTAPPFGESSIDFGYRVCSTFEKLVEGMMKSGVFETAIITHAGVMSTILSAYGLPEAPMHEWMTDYGYGYTLRVDPSMWMRGKKFEVFAKLPAD